MKYHVYTFAASDFVMTAVACLSALVLFVILGVYVVSFFGATPGDATGFDDPETDATFEGGPDLSETGIAAEIAKLPPGSQLVEVDTAGMLTLPKNVWVHEYVWTGSEIRFVRRVPLHEFDFLLPGSALHAASHPEALAAREDFFKHARKATAADILRK